MAPAFREMQLGGWGGVSRHPAHVYRPARVHELFECLREATPVGKIARGLGRSYGDSATLDDGQVLLSERLNRMIAFDADRHVLTCEAGVSFAEILQVFVPRGYFLPVTPGTKFVTVGGAIAADVHGKNHHLHGSIGHFVESLDVWTGRGDTLHCSPTENSDVFWATVGGMGLTGYILRASLRLIPIETNRVRVDYLRLANLDELLPHLVGQDQADATYSVAWIDCISGGRKLGRSVLMLGEHARRDEVSNGTGHALLEVPKSRTKTVPFYFPALALNSLSVKAFNAVYYRVHPSRQGVVTSYESFFYPLDAINHWNRVYGRRGFVQYQALFPFESCHDGTRKLLNEIVRSAGASYLAVIKRTGAATPGMLSFCFPGITLALDLPNTGQRLRELVHRLDAKVLDHGGRLYLAKDALSAPETFANMYPRIDEFRQLRERIDPEGVFVSAQAKRLGIVQ